MSEQRRVVVTGMGMVTPIGTGVDRFLDGLRSGRSAVLSISRFDTSPYRSTMAAEINDFDATDHFGPKEIRRIERFAQMSVVSARLAVEHSGLDLSHVDPNAVGVSMGSALGGVGLAEEQCLAFLQEGMRALSLSLALSVYGGAANCRIGMVLGVTGPSLSNSNSCASGTMAIGEAMLAIRSGRAEVMLAGGAESPIHPLCYGAFDIIKSMSTRNDEPEKACRPFDRERDGFVMGEGAAVLVLEELGHAVSRDARILCEVAGYACTNDSYNMTAPRPDGSMAARAMTLAMNDGGLSPEEVEYVNAHGSSTPLNDKAETIAIKTALGDRAYRVPISGTKSMHGHSLGAAGAIEACATALAMSEGFVPPTANLDKPDEDCDLDYTPVHCREQEIRCALSDSFGFGGINAVLAFRQA